MDSKEHHEVQELIREGRSPNDEGPFYHHAFWESYKGSVKGKLGGLIIGALAGALVGGAIFGVAAIAGITAITGIAVGAMTVIGGMAAAGMLYANREFSEVGRITGAVAATQKVAEDRMQEFEQSRFNDLKQEMDQIKAMVAGRNATTTDPAPANHSQAPIVASPDAVDEKLDSYRTTHHDPRIPKPQGSSLVFWKVAAVGIAVGVGVGLLLSAIGATAVLASVLPLKLGVIVEGWQAATITGGIIGASFGINRDAFRQIFDKTDMLFKGMFKFSDPAMRKSVQPTLNASKDRPEVSTLVYPDSGIDYPTSDTFHRDQLAARANQLLASLDHTTVSRH